MDLPSRPRLAPGLRVVRRGTGHLQVGLHPDRRAVLPRTPLVEEALAALLDHRPADPAVLTTLHRHGCLVDDTDRTGDGRRHGTRVAVHGGLASERALLAAAGLRVVGAGHHASVALVAVTGEPDRALLDPFVRSGTPHLVARVVDGGAVLGPFVVPGATPCLRCLDSEAALADPDHVAVTERYTRASARERSDGLPDVLDPVLPTLAAAWAVRDVVAHLDGIRPSTWSRTLHLAAEPGPPREQVWARHPACGCSWLGPDLPSGTMGA